MKLRLVILAFGLVWAAGCSSAVSSGPGETEAATETETETTEDELNGTCNYPKRYIAVMHEGECTEVVARRGRWVPSRLFEEAPEIGGACFYTWSGERYARVDRLALQHHVEFPGTLTPSCGQERIDDYLDLVEIEHLSPGSVAGAVGCDVCGIQRDGKIYAVLPPEKVHFRELQVKLSSGRARTFQIQGSEGARRVAITLPPAPRGTSYVNGPVQLQ